MSPSWAVAVAAGLAGACLATAGLRGASLQDPLDPPVVVEARFEADLTRGDGSARVAVDYRVRGLPPGMPVRVRALAFDGREPRGLEVDGRSVALTRTEGTAWGGVFTPARSGGEAYEAAAAAGRAAAEPGAAAPRFSLVYRVEGLIDPEGDAFSARIPVVTLDLGAGPPRPDHFAARLRLPSTWTLLEGFPTSMTSVGSGVFEASLPVVPSMMGLRGRRGGGWRPAMPLVLDLLALAGLVAFGVGGWRHLRRTRDHPPVLDGAP